jgi:hypothetical protein
MNVMESRQIRALICDVAVPKIETKLFGPVDCPNDWVAQRFSCEVSQEISEACEDLSVMRQRSDNGLRARPKPAGSSQIHRHVEKASAGRNRVWRVNLGVGVFGTSLRLRCRGRLQTTSGLAHGANSCPSHCRNRRQWQQAFFEAAEMSEFFKSGNMSPHSKVSELTTPRAQRK